MKRQSKERHKQSDRNDYAERGRRRQRGKHYEGRQQGNRYERRRQLRKMYERARDRSDSESRRRNRDNRERDRDHYKNYHHSEKQYHGYDQSRERRSRSRSKEKQSTTEYYDERKSQEKEHQIRQAIRKNTINKDARLFEVYAKMPEIKKEELADQAHSTEKIHQCILVRELYVSGLYDMSKASIKEFFSTYGQVQDVEVIKNFIFVKYMKIEDASNACADYRNINKTLHESFNPGFKIFFADHQKRFNIVSNHPAFQIKEYLIPVIYANLKNDSEFTNQQYLRSIFDKYGIVRNLQVKITDLPTEITYVLVEYETMAMAFRARDKLRSQREKLGGSKSEITILIDNEKITRLYPSINKQLRYTSQSKLRQQRKRQQLRNAVQMTLQMNQMQLMTAITHPMDNLNSYNYAQPSVSSHAHDTMQTQDIFNMLKEFTEKMEPQEEQAESDWFGFFTRNKQYKVEVDFNRIHQEPFELESILNVSHRADLKEGLSRTDYVLAGKFKAANKASIQPFNEYINYFKKKQRGGIIFTNSYLIYLIPPLPELNIPYPLESNELLALFFQII